MIEISLQNVFKSFGADPVLKGINLELKETERLGLIGSNGSGKTTIFRLITGNEVGDSGVISLRKERTIGYLHQVPDAFNSLQAEAVLQLAFRDLFQIRQRMARIEAELEHAAASHLEELMRDYGELQNQFEQQGGYKIEMLINKICAGLKIGDELRQRPFESLSGGEKTTVMLARLLLENPDILLLDEPTNHLDIEAVEWLEGYLLEFRGSLIIISHDRYFLDRVVTRIVEIEQGRSCDYAGNYTFYLEEKQRRFLGECEVYKNTRKQIKALKAAAERYRTWGNINPDNSAHMARAIRLEKKIEELKLIRKPAVPRKYHLRFRGDRSGKDVIILDKVAKQFSGRTLFAGLSLHVRYGEKAVIIGRNGTGKSTLFRMLLGEVEPDAGQVRLGVGVEIAYLEQDVVFPEPEQRVIDVFREHYPMFEGEARNHLSRFLFTGDDVFQKISSLSGGEKVRLKLCLLVNSNRNLLLLDEPTNHLDTRSREAVEEAVNKFPGTAVIISHDRYFINKTADSVIELDQLTLTRYEGNYDDYKIRRQEVEEREIRREELELKRPRPSGEAEADFRKLRNRANALERDISWLEKEIAELEEEAAGYPTDYRKLMEIEDAKRDRRETLRLLYEEWQELNEQAEGITRQP